VKFTVAARKDGSSQCLTISKHEGQHNHDVSSETYRLYPSVRRLTPDERQQQEQLVSIVLIHLKLIGRDQGIFQDFEHGGCEPTLGGVTASLNRR